MRIDWAHDPNAPTPCRVVNTETGEVLSPCVLADEETGEYVRVVLDAQGRIEIDSSTRLVKVTRGFAPLRIEML